jgi:outer membrane cobalamin receptor
MKPISLILTACCLVLLCFVRPVRARSEADTADNVSANVYELEMIVIVKGKRVRDPSTTVELELADIREKNAVTVADALRSESGLSVTTGPKAETETRIRGLPARDVLVLVDGRSINPGYYGKVDLAMLPVDNIAKVKVIKGPASVAYGANSMGGVINIVTKNGLETPRTEVESELGDYGYRKVTVNHSRQTGLFNYWFSGYDNYSRGYRLSDDFERTSVEDGGLRDNSSYHKIGVNGKLGYEPSKTSLYSLSLSYHWAKKDISPTVYSWDSPRFWHFPNWQRFNSALSGYWRLYPAIELKSIFFVDAQHDRLVEYDGSEMRDDQVSWDSKLENWTVGGRIDGKINSWQNHLLHAGLEVKRDLMNKKPDLDSAWYSYHTYTVGAFLQDVYQPWEKTEVTLGLNYNLYANQDSSSVGRLQSKGRLCPMVGVVQQLHRGLACHANYGRAIRFPTLHHLYSQTSGNPELKPEQADKYEISLRKRFVFDTENRHISLEIAWFHNDLTNLIYRASKSYVFTNIGKAKSQGWELRTDWEVFNHLSFGMSWAHLQVSETTDELLEEVSPNKVRIYLSAKTNFGTELNYERNYFDERTTYRPDLMLSDYTTHNVNISQEVGYSLRLRLEVSNIADDYYEEELGYPGLGRQFMVGLTWEK